MKKLRELLRTNRWFAVVLLLEAAVLASLAASLFGAPYKLQLTPADFSNDYPQIAAVNEDGTALQIWNNSEDFTPPEDKTISFSTAGSAMRSGAYEVTVQYFSCQMPDAPTFNALYSAGSLSFASKGNPSAISADAVTLDDCHRTATTRLWVGYGARMQDLTATLTYGEGQLYLYGITLTEQPIYRLTRLVIFVLLAAVTAMLWWYDTESYDKLCLMMFSGMTFCLIIYMVLPNGLDIRPTPEAIGRENFAMTLMQLIWKADASVNVCPSIHCQSTACMAIAFSGSTLTKQRPWLKAAAWVWAAIICASTVFTKQHSIIDVVCGLALAAVWGVILYGPWKKRQD